MSPATTTLLRLMQLSSSCLPVGGYAYSRGMEQAVEAGWLKNQADTELWLKGLLEQAITHTDIPLFKRMYLSWQEGNEEELVQWNNTLFAMRESYEFQAEETNMGRALAKLLASLKIPGAAPWQRNPRATFINLFALAACHYQIPLPDGCCGYIWSWIENQVAAAIKLVPLGQTAGQEIIASLIPLVDDIVTTGLTLPQSEIGFTAHALAMASGLHETQRTRLFRS